MIAATCLVYHIDEGLCIIPREVSDHLCLIAIRESYRDQRDTLVHGEGIADQSFPGWGVRSAILRLLRRFPSVLISPRERESNILGECFAYVRVGLIIGFIPNS